MNPITECKNCSDCAVRLGFGFTQPDVLICTVRGDEAGPGDGCTLGSPRRARAGRRGVRGGRARTRRLRHGDAGLMAGGVEVVAEFWSSVNLTGNQTGYSLTSTSRS